MDQLREQHRATPEVTLLHKIAELKGLLADGERRIEALKGEKNAILSEKEQFRASVHKLVCSMLEYCTHYILTYIFSQTNKICSFAGESSPSGACNCDEEKRMQQSASLSKL